MKQYLQTAKALILGLILAGGLQIAAAAWTSAPANPPQNNVEAPINGSEHQQLKKGALLLNSGWTVNGQTVKAPIGLRMWGKAIFYDGIDIPQTGMAEGMVLTAKDTSGGAEWRLAGGGAETGVVRDYAYFGGMYSVNYNNPLAGNTQGCTSGYVAWPVLGTTNVDNNLFVCYGDPDSVEPIVAFGGMYSTSFNNPVTSAKSCPAGTGWVTRVTFGTTDLDNSITYCYNTNAAASGAIKFSGLYTPNVAYGNVVTGGGLGCFIRQRAVEIFGTNNLDNTMYLCVNN